MGALTTNRKRGNWFSLSHALSPLSSKDYEVSPELHISKKPRISPIHLSSELSSPPNTVSKISRYPRELSRLPREVHAPCRRSKFVGRPASSLRESLPGIGRLSEIQESIGKMGNTLFRQYDAAKALAVGAVQNLVKEKEPLTDEEAKCSKDVVSDDSSVEVIDALNDRREGLSVDSDHTSKRTNSDVLPWDTHSKLPAAGQQPSPSAVSELTKVDEGGKMIAFLSVSSGTEELRMPLHKKLLLECEGRRNSKLSLLSHMIKLFETKLSFFGKYPAKRPVEHVPREPFIPLSQEEEAEVSRALSSSSRRRVLVRHENSNIDITGEMLQCLSPNAWLNDEVINVYLELLKEREKREPDKFLKCHFFNTFFYKKLISGTNGYDFRAVRRWTTMRKIGYGLIECDKIFVPIHKRAHWVLAVINKKDEKIQYLDSYKGMDPQALEVLARYFVDEVKDKSGKNIDLSSWELEYVDELPEQRNGWDCGMFMLKYIDFYSRGLSLRFNEEHMPYFRRRTAKEILRLEAQ